jgi:predicted  nucleic acid-binding Zn-ribbon protein
MPHQCTTCGNVFADGSKEMLGGCPECDNNTFQFHPGEAPEEPTEASPPDDGGVATRVGRAADSVRDFVAGGETEWPDWPGAEDDDTPPGNLDPDSDSDPDTDAPPADSAVVEGDADTDLDREDRAQADARSEVVDPADLPPSERPSADPDTDAPLAEDTTAVSGPEDDSGADLSALREELNEQFESIRIVEPGQYELNLMELYEREEYIIALQEDGRYVIEVPDHWREDDPDDG